MADVLGGNAKSWEAGSAGVSTAHVRISSTACMALMLGIYERTKAQKAQREGVVMTAKTMAEVCRLCNGPTTVRTDEDIPLCQGHWNAWLGRYLNLYPGHESEQAPCAAHLIFTNLTNAAGGRE